MKFSRSDFESRGSNPAAPASQSGLHRVTYEGRSKPRGTTWFRTLEFPITAGSRWRATRSAISFWWDVVKPVGRQNQAARLTNRLRGTEARLVVVTVGRLAMELLFYCGRWRSGNFCIGVWRSNCSAVSTVL
jgi:hypothetical protein